MWGNLIFTLVLAAFGYLVLVRLRKLLGFVSEVVLQLWVFTGPTYARSYAHPYRVLPYFCKVEYLDAATLVEICNFQRRFIEPLSSLDDEAELARHIKALKQYSHVLLLRDRMDGCLRGTQLYKIEHHGTHTVLQGGLGVLDTYYKGGPYINVTVFLLAVREKLAHPLTPLYIIVKSYGIEIYLMTVKYGDVFPRYDKPTPEVNKKIAEEWVRPQMLPDDEYDRETCVLKRRVTHVKENVSQVDELDRKNPHVDFYLKANPGFREGDCLVITACVDFRLIITAIGRLRDKILGKRKGPRHAIKKRPPLVKRMTFQENKANRILAMTQSIAIPTKSGDEEEEETTPPDSPYSPTSSEVDMEVDLEGLENIYRHPSGTF